MNIYLLELLSKIIRILFVSMVSLFNSFSVSTTSLTASNTVINKSLNANNKVVAHTTTVTYNSKLPSNVTRVISEGIDGVVYVDDENNEKKILALHIGEDDLKNNMNLLNLEEMKFDKIDLKDFDKQYRTHTLDTTIPFWKKYIRENELEEEKQEENGKDRDD